MFYSQFILAKKGPLGTIWIAAHLERKLRKNQISDTDIGVSVDSILSPDVPIALRLSSHLLLGVVRIYSKKVNYLFDDCSEALLKVKQAFRSTAVDLPPEESKAPYHSITLPETFDLDDFELPETELFQGNFVDHHVSSKEQITLQDTMDNVVYSASQYGLDERFGDGEASQIGLDLDEELLFSKGSPSGHGVLLTSRVDPEALFEPSSPQICDELDDEVHEPIQAVATNCNIEAPTTPGLVEAPNVHCTEGVLVSDDHMEVDNNPSHVEYGNGTNGCAFETQQIEKSTPQVESPSTAEPMELIDSSNVAHINGSDMVCEVSNGLHVECVQNVSLGVSVLDGGLAVNCTREFEEAQETGINESTVLLSDSHKHPSPSEERGSHHDKSSVIGFESVSENTSLVDNSTLGPETEAERELRISSNSENKGGHNLSGPEASEIWNADAKADTMSVYKPILQPCNFRTNEENAEFGNVLPVLNLPSKDIGVGSEGMAEKEDVSEVYVAKGQDVHDMNSKEGHLLDTTTPFSRIDEQPEISENVQFQKGNDSVASELPSPEKMLSLPDVPINQSNRLFEGSTPEREVLVQGDHDAIMNQLSGKKRSLTESTIALQTFNSVESSEAAQTKRSVDFIPGDDDLLSSILVGRQSTALKVKSTPPAYDMASSKRPRATPRSGAHKRKVIVDDSMVLHGDTIRQQLMSTEDIRRVRKKAPSTHPEIWILQKQFLEDEIFKDPIFTGMSAKLVTLHCHPFELSEIKLVQDDGRRDQTSTDIIGSEIKLVQDDGRRDQTTTDIIGTPVRPTMGEEYEFDGTSVLSAGKDESRQQSIECSYDTPAPSGVSLDLGSIPENERKNDSEGGHTPSQFDISENQTEIEAECRREPVADEADHSVALGVESSSSHPSVFEHHDNLINSDVIQPSCLKDISDAGVSDQVDRSCLRLDEQLSVRDTLPVEDTPVVVGMEDVDSTIHMTDVQPGSSLPVNDENIIVEDRISDEGRTHEPGTVREFPESDLNFDHEDLSFNHHKEDLNIDSSDPAFDGFDLQNQFSKSQIFMDINATASDDPTLGNFSTQDLEADAIEHDTDFLNFDDDEIAEEDDNYMPDTEGPHVLDNSGWSTRTRGVANYLQVLFHKAAQQGRTDLHLDNLLANKTRKEASRMFFETLVLKTRDYIHVDQPSPFDNVSVKPRARLLKSEFR